MHGPPQETPIGLLMSQTGRTLERAFDDALAQAGGTRPSWLIMIAIISGRGTTQSALAEAVGITGATLVHHLDRLERAGLVARQADPSNRRVRTLVLTEAGRDTFLRMREAAMAFDARLRSGISEREQATLRRLLDRIRSNATTEEEE